jgi:hypothetical protein
MSENPYAQVIAEIARGARLHYENPESADPDLDLLLGDQSYASGLRRLAALGDVEETARLAELISRVAQAYAEGDAALGRQLLADAEVRLSGDDQGCRSGHVAAQAGPRDGVD